MELASQPPLAGEPTYKVKMKKLLLSLLTLLLLSFGASAQNNAPVLTDIGNQTTDEDNTLSSVSVIFTDSNPTDTHTITVVSNEANVSVANLSGNTSGSTYDLVPVANWNGTAQITVTVTDNGIGALSDFETYTLTVNPTNDAPVLTEIGNQSVDEDHTLSGLAVVFTDIDGSGSYGINIVSDEANVSVANLSGNTSGSTYDLVPVANWNGTAQITVTVTDNGTGALSDFETYTLTVNPTNDAPTFTSVPGTSATQDVPYIYTAVAEDIDGDDLIYTAPVLPSWLTFTAATQVLSGTPANADVGDTTVTIRVFDGTVSVDQSFFIAVANVNDAPTFSSSPIISTSQGALYEYTASALDIDVDDVLTFTAPVLPGWLTFDMLTQLLSGTPGNDDVGDHDVTIRVNDGTVDVDQIFVISVANENDAPTFSSAPDTVATQDAAYLYIAVAEDIDGDGLTFTAPVLPEWLDFNASSQRLSGTPGNDDVGDHDVTIRVYDGTVSVDQVFVISVANENDGPVFTSIPNTTAAEDVAYSYTPTALDIDGDILTFTAPVLPEWLTFNEASQLLSGTPENDDVGDHNVTIRASDGTTSVDQFFVITVINENDAPTFTSSPITTISQNALYEYTVSAEDIDGDELIYSAPVLPGWLTLNATTQLLSGIPGNSDVGGNNITLRIFDGLIAVDQSFVILVDNVNDAPNFTSTPVTSVKQGVAYTYTVSAIDVDGDAMTYSAPVLPGWLAFNSSTHVLNATPGIDNLGVHNVTLRVSDGTLSADQSFKINVLYGNSAPTFTSDPATYARTDVVYAYTITAEDQDGDALTYTAPIIPEWLTFYPATHLVIGEPHQEDIGTYPITLRISDGTVAADQSFTITVFKANNLPVFTSTPQSTVLEGNEYTYTATAEDIDGDALTFSAPFLPDWLSFDISTHTLSGTPAYDDAGIYNVTLRVSDGYDSDDQEFTITVEENGSVGINMALLKDQLLLYPNPTDGRFILELSGAYEADLTFEIFDQTGKLVLQQIFPSHAQIRKEFDLSSKPPGIYFIRIYHDSQQTMGKLILH